MHLKHNYSAWYIAYRHFFYLLVYIRIKAMVKSLNFAVEINMRHSLDLEVRRVILVKQKAEWFKKMGYRLSLPGSLNLDNLKKISQEEAEEYINKEYKEDDYKNANIKIQEDWAAMSMGFKEKLLKYELNPLDVYDVFLTKYGVKGSYDLPNSITINFKQLEINNISRVIMHEIVHLLIEGLIQKYNVEHWRKERIVDLICFKINPTANYLQSIPIETEKIDKAFDSFFPNIEKVIQNS